MNAHKKRAKGNWRQGKGYKGDSEERMYAKKEITEEVKTNNDDHLTRHKSKRKKNLKARLEYWILFYSQKLEEYQRNGHSGSSTYLLREGLERAQKEFEEKFSKKKKDS